MVHSRPTSSSIWIRPVQSVWLLLNLVWLNAVVPAMLVWAITGFRDPNSQLAVKLATAALIIIVIPLAAVLGFALVTWLLVAWVERAWAAARRSP